MIWVNTLILAFPQINGRKLIGTTTVENIKKSNPTKIKIFREGEDHIRKSIIPFFDLIQAENPFDQFQMDEWHIEFACKNNNKKTRLILFTIMDSCSRKIVHWSQNENFNSSIVKKTLGEAVKMCRDRFAAELVCDFASINTAEVIKNIMGHLTDKYKPFKWTISSNPNRKAILERFFGAFSSVYLSPVVGATFQGPMSTRENSSPAKYLGILLNKPEYLHDIEALKQIISDMLNQYNRNGMHKDSLSPNEVFEKNRAVNVINISSQDYALMFCEKHGRKLSNTTVVANIKDMTRKYKCTTTDAALANESMVDLYVREEAPDIGYVFKNNTTEYLGEFIVYEKFHAANVNVTESEKVNRTIRIEDREKMVKALDNLKPDLVKELTTTLGVSPTDFIEALTNLTTYKPTQISDLLGTKTDSPKQISPFNLLKPKGMKLANKKRKEELESEKTRATILNSTFNVSS